MAQNKAKTIDGAPIPISNLNVEPPSLLENPNPGPLARLAKFYKRLNEVMSGMYTGVGCAGTPHSHHSYEEDKKVKNPSD